MAHLVCIDIGESHDYHLRLDMKLYLTTLITHTGDTATKIESIILPFKTYYFGAQVPILEVRTT